MNPLPGRCPVCANALSVTRLQCGHCGTGVDGLFSLGRLQALTPEHIQFVETFMKCKGKIKDVEAEMGISYPTVVGKLNEVVRAMGYEVEEGDMSEVDQYEVYQARVLSPQVTGQRGPTPPAPPIPPVPPVGPLSHGPKLTPEKRQQIMDDLAAGKLSAAEAMKRLHG
ncbi:MAG: DUF2089 domain-containing protein [Chloroflexota bacterium]|nr:DUF2089 domain-containing protein [Chloroflexota bacterium]